MWVWTDWMQPSVVFHDNWIFFEDFIFVIASNGCHSTLRFIVFNDTFKFNLIGHVNWFLSYSFVFGWYARERKAITVIRIEKKGNIKSSFINMLVDSSSKCINFSAHQWIYLEII